MIGSFPNTRVPMLDLTRRSDKSDIAKRRERAEKFLQKGKTSAALDEYVAILREDPDNDAVRQTAADLYLSINDPKEAAKLFSEMFDRQANSSDSSNAIITYKKLARFTTPNPEQSFRYGTFLETTNKKEALETYETALSGFTAQKNNRKALVVLERIVAAEPSGQNFWRAGELASEMNDLKRAAMYFFSVGELEENAGGNAAPWYERAYKSDPLNPSCAVAHSRSLLAQNHCAEALEILQPLMADRGTVSLEVRDLYGRALLGVGKLVEAEPILWELFETNPERLPQIVDLIASMIDSQQDHVAVVLARKLEQYQRRQGNRREFITFMKDLVEKHRASSEVLEFLVELFNASNRENEYSQTLIKLFDVYYEAGNFQKASDCLDRAADVDAYETGHQKRLEMLRGKIDPRKYDAIAGRLTHANKAVEHQKPQQQEPEEPTMLQDLMLQAEILVQYGMRSKAVERLQRIQQLFPHEEEKNEELHRLYLNVGLMPRYSDAPPAMASAAVAGAAGSGSAISTGAAPAVSHPPALGAARDENDIRNLERVTEITRSLYQQANVKNVLTVAVNSIGEHWNALRCMASLRGPGKPPTLMLEYVAEGVTPSDAGVRAKLLGVLQDVAVSRGPIVVPNASALPELADVEQEMASIEFGSLLVLPLVEGQEQVGVLVLQAGVGTEWRPSDMLVLRSLCEQMVLALHNARLRRLVRNLSATDEKSGLLKRSSYLDVLLSEARRAVQQNSPTTVVLMEFGKNSAMVKEFGHAAVEGMLKQVGQIISTHIRQADVAVLYDTTTIALLLADTPEKGAFLAIDKLRRVLTDINLPGRDTPPVLSVGIAEAAMRAGFDPVDIVTEMINRVEAALVAASADPTNKVQALQPELETAAA